MNPAAIEQRGTNPGTDRSSSIGRPRRKDAIVDALLVLGFLAIAMQQNLSVATGLRVPPDPDHFRDAALAQTMADGGWNADAFLPDEQRWYNPLVPGIVALLHRVTSVPVLEIYAGGGVVLNVVAPLTFWWLARVVFGSGPALAALLIFLLLPPAQLAGWASAGYWPWLFANLFTQGLFYAGLIAADYARRSGRVAAWLLSGGALGLVFLGHTAPALLLACVLVLAAAWMWREGCPARRCAALLAACFVTFLFVSLPLTVPVVGHYRLVVANVAPAAWEFPGMAPVNFVDLLQSHADIRGALALAGLGLLAFDRVRRSQAVVVTLWGAAVGGFLALHYLRASIDGAAAYVPRVLPAFHFLFYAEAILALLAGYGLWRIVDGSAAVVGRLAPSMPGALVTRAALVAIVLVSVKPALDRRRAREDFDESRQRALQYQSREGDRLIRQWIRARTPPNTMFLASDGVSLYVVGPAGGKVVALENVFANPYVNMAVREQDRYGMEERLLENDLAGYCARAARYKVEYMITDEKRGDLTVPRETFLKELYAADGIRVWRTPVCASPDLRQ
jgi:hypothetical protein